MGRGARMGQLAPVTVTTPRLAVLILLVLLPLVDGPKLRLAYSAVGRSALWTESTEKVRSRRLGWSSWSNEKRSMVTLTEWRGGGGGEEVCCNEEV
ncbi:MAG: hypothetical protein J3Q66DRAFT_345421 [Benniella sp.]|nr:MAG: hypothetical protein J3Q66DRAFT_345421 [Benniella sp.]